ncbi:hypothetical protein [Streptococcus anginosus]|uniref:hypothetical protein n=1 Tax=Streptococcus anginosus TaxID=1328 RepID=UPI0011057FAA|nr:hypothetical protein [Streptococcus anginosus]
MYRLTNLTLDTTTTYKNKDLVYQALDRENAKVKHQEAEGVLLAEELDKKGVVIYQEDIYLPFDGIADSLFLKARTITTPETTKKEKRFSFLNGSRGENDQEPSSKAKQEPRKALSAPQIKEKEVSSSSNWIKRIMQVVGLFLLIISFVFSLITTQLFLASQRQVRTLQHQVTRLTQFQEQTGKLDTFGRYFLPSYYSEKGQLADFSSSRLTLNHQSGQLQSVILEYVSQMKKDTYQLTYVLAIKEGETRSQKRLSLVVQKEKAAPYGYQVVQIPEVSNYPK